MIDLIDLNKYDRLYKDFLHPNPNINYKAILTLKKDFRSQFMNDLFTNLIEKDLFIRRRSIMALGEYGDEIFNYIVPIYFNSKNVIVKVSCLKIILKVIVDLNLKELNMDIMSVLDSAIKDNSPEIILSTVSILRLLGPNGRDILIRTCRDKDLLRAKASVSALLEIKDQVVDNFLDQLLNDKLIDSMIKEDILRDKLD